MIKYIKCEFLNKPVNQVRIARQDKRIVIQLLQETKFTFKEIHRMKIKQKKRYAIQMEKMRTKGAILMSEKNRLQENKYS